MGEIVEKAKAAIGEVENLGEMAGRIFTRFDPAAILRDAERAQALVEASPEPLPLAGKLVSVKDLFDEKGERTTAGSRLLMDRPEAGEDCTVVARMKAAGAVMFGRTAMSEFAYSGVGLNPHYGTPGNVFDETRIPGGSTSGGGVSAGLGLVDIALGTDTGGSVRIPAAINGLYGFKPTQSAVPLTGVHSLSTSLDSAGPLCRDLATLVAAFAVMSASAPVEAAKADVKLRLAVPVGAFVSDLDAQVAADYKTALQRLEAAGHHFVEIDMSFLQDAIGLNRTIVASEALAQYRDNLDLLEVIGDPHVLKRIRFAETVSEAELAEGYKARAALVERFCEEMSEVDALAAPTLQRMAPTIEETKSDFDRLNAAMLRNTSLINLADGCAISMPVASEGAASPGALMLAQAKGRDRRLLRAAWGVDRAL